MKIFCIGDVIGPVGCEYLRSVLPNFKREQNIDIVIANGENSSATNGISPNSAEYLFSSGVDIITTGNHVYRRKEIHSYFDTCDYLIRPANFPNTNPGKGYCIYDMGYTQVCVINLLGTLYMDNYSNPFITIDELLKTIDSKIIIVDFHAEATSEKVAMGLYLDGRVSAVFGTHTHVQTADETILQNGTGYISDIGMTGPIHSVIGVVPEIAINKFKNLMPTHFNFADGKCKLNGIILDIDKITGKTTNIYRVNI